MIDRFFDTLYPETDGAMQASNMRFILSIPGGKGKTLTKRAVVLLVTVSLVIVLAIVLLAGFLGADTPRHFHEKMDVLKDGIGHSKAEVFEILADNGNAMAELSEELALVSGGMEFGELDFAVILSFEQNEGLLNGFTYTTEAKVDPSDAAKVLKKFLSEFYNKSIVLDNGEEVPIKEKDIKNTLKSGGFVFHHSENCTPGSGKETELTQYLSYLENAQYYEGRVGEYLTKKAKFYRDISILYSGENVLSIKLKYQVEPDRSK